MSSTSSDFNPLSLITAPVTGLFNFLGAGKQADAAKTAAQLQATATQNALDYTKQKQGEQQAAFAPYQALGAQAAGTLGSIVRPNPSGGPPPAFNGAPSMGYMPGGSAGMPASPQMAQSQMAPQGVPLSAMGGQPPASSMPAPQGPTVLLQGPDGSQKRVPANVAQQYIARGAKQIG